MALTRYCSYLENMLKLGSEHAFAVLVPAKLSFLVSFRVRPPI